MTETPTGRRASDRRYRLHTAGDHSECHPNRCAVLITERALSTDGISAVSAVRNFAEHIKSDCRPCSVFFAAALRLAAGVDSGVTRSAGELRHTTLAMAGCEYCSQVETAIDPLDELRRRREASAQGPYAV